MSRVGFSVMTLVCMLLRMGVVYADSMGELLRKRISFHLDHTYCPEVCSFCMSRHRYPDFRSRAHTRWQHRMEEESHEVGRRCWLQYANGFRGASRVGPCCVVYFEPFGFNFGPKVF